MSTSNKKEWHVNQENNKEYDFRYNRIEEKNTWLNLTNLSRIHNLPQKFWD